MGEPTFWELVRWGIVTPRSVGVGDIEIETSGWVGSAIVGDRTLRVNPKFPGTVEALLRWISAVNDVADVEARESATGLDPSLVRAFAETAQAYLQRRTAGYRDRLAFAPVPHGPLNVARTLICRAGRGPLAVVYRDYRVRPEGPVDRVLEAACVDVERHRGQLQRDTLVCVRRVLIALQTDGYGPSMPVAQAIAEARTLQAANLDNCDRRLAVLCELVLTARAAGLRDATSAASAGFVDLAKVFEVAVRELLRERLGGGHAHDGKHLNAPLFEPGIAGTVDPDLVLGPLNRPFAVGDVKYKSGAVARSELYQLLVHTAAFRAPGEEPPMAFLIRLGRSFSVSELGLAVTGSRTTVFEVSPLALDRDISHVVGYLRSRGYGWSDDAVSDGASAPRTSEGHAA